jgi:hypothetical protein
MLHLYALVEEPARLPAGTGIARAPLRAVAAAARLEAVVSTHEEQPAPTETAIVEHAQVVDELIAVNEAVLPARFGGWYSSDAALTKAIVPRADALCDALERVRGCVEVGLRVVGSSDRLSVPETGSQYMRERLDVLNDVQQLADEVAAALAPLAKDSARQVQSRPQPTVSSTYLLGQADVREFQRRVADLASAHPELTIVCTGPWAAYSFGLVDAAP